MDDNRDDPAVIIGLACRLPGGINSPSGLWDHLIHGKNAKKPVPVDRWNRAAFQHAGENSYSTDQFQKGYFIEEDLRCFDQQFFGISSEELECMDPQQKKLLEVTYECLESAGLPLDRVAGTHTGCYVGCFTTDFETAVSKEPQLFKSYTALGSARATLAGRLSYVFDLHGPSLTVDTACSSSLYALHLACQGIATGDSTMALAAGTTLILSPDCHLKYDKLGALSGTAQCHAFDTSADGYARAEAITVMCLKKLSQALKDGDPIRAVIRGSAINANGKGAGLTQPRGVAQEAAVRRAYAQANLDPDQITYFECHGTGTTAGDAAEIELMSRLFSSTHNAGSPLLFGSVKPNLGHSEAASTLTSVMKVLLAMEHGKIPATIDVTSPNTKISSSGGKLKLLTENTAWPEGKPKIASVNSTGLTGSNAHIVLQDGKEYLKSLCASKYRMNGDLDLRVNDLYQEMESRTRPRRNFVLQLSAHDEHALHANATALDLIIENSNLWNLSYTLSARRTLLRHRAYKVIGPSFNEQFVFGGQSPIEAPTLGFVFTGQGAQWRDMGLGLLESFPFLQEICRDMDLALSSLEPPPESTILEIFTHSTQSPNIDAPEMAQPLCTAVQILLVELLRQFGINPVATIGHSSGEIAAAFAAGHIRSDEAIVIAYLRGLAVSKHRSTGCMLAVGTGVQTATTLINVLKLNESIRVACVNSPSSVTLSGDADSIQLIEATLKSQGFFVRKLRTSGIAYHSHHMKPVGEDYEQMMNRALGESHSVPSENIKRATMHSTVTQGVVDRSTLSSHYWRQNLESMVLFPSTLENLLRSTRKGAKNVDYLLEIGPHHSLKGPIRQTLEALEPCDGFDPTRIAYGFTLKHGDVSEKCVLRTVGSLFLAGYPVDMIRLNAELQGERNPGTGMYPILSHGKMLIDLPVYNWSRTFGSSVKRYRADEDWKFNLHGHHDLLGDIVPGCNRLEPVWRNHLSINSLPWLKDHQIGDDILFPASGYVSMAIEAVAQYAEKGGDLSFRFEDAGFNFPIVSLHHAMTFIKTEDAREVDLTFSLKASDDINVFRFTVASVANDRWIVHCTGTISYNSNSGLPTVSNSSPDSLCLPDSYDLVSMYNSLKIAGYRYGKTFQLSEIRGNPRRSQAQATVRLAPPGTGNESRYAIHPAALDGIFQTAIIARMQGQPDRLPRTQVPVVLKDMTIRPALAGEKHNNPASLNATSTVTAEGLWTTTSDITASFIGTGERMVSLKAEMHDFVHERPSPTTRRPYQRLLWKPDITLLTGGDLHQYLERALVYHRALATGVQRLFANCMADLIVQITDDQWTKAPPKYQSIFQSLTRVYEKPGCRNLLDETSKNTDSMLGTVVNTTQIKSSFDSLRRILCGQTQTEKSQAPDDLVLLLSGAIFSCLVLPCLNQVAQLIAHKNPSIRILGLRGTGSLSASILKLSEKEPASLVESYTCCPHTEVAPNPCLNDSATDPPEILPQGHFDIVIVSRNLQCECARDATALLKKGGYVFAYEYTDAFLETSISNGSHGESESPQKGCDRSQDIGIETVQPLAYSRISLDRTGWIDNTEKLATDVIRVRQEQFSKIVLIRSREQSPFVDVIATQFIEKGFRVSQECLEDISSAKYHGQTRYIVFQELAAPVLANMSAQAFAGLQGLVRSASTILWVTAANIVSVNDLRPENTLAHGFARSIMGEELGRDFIFSTLDIDRIPQTTVALEKLGKLCLDLENKLFTRTEHIPVDLEYACKNETVYISRWVEDKKLNQKFTEENIAPGRQIYWTHERPWYLKYTDQRETGAVCFHEDTSILTDPLLPDEIEIQVAAVGLSKENRRAVADAVRMKSAGSMSYAGSVLRMGSEVSGIQHADRVLALQPGDYNSFIRTKVSQCIKLIENDDCQVLAALCVPYCTAIYSLLHLAKLERGETVLLAVESTVMAAAAQIAQTIGAEVFVVASSDEAVHLRKRCGIPATHVLSPKSALGLTNSLTNGRGIDVLLCDPSVNNLEPLGDFLADFGRLVTVGKTGVLKWPALEFILPDKCISILSCDFTKVIDCRPNLINALLKQMLTFYREGLIQPGSAMKFHITDITKAFDAVGDPDGGDAVVLDYASSTRQIMVHGIYPHLLFDSSASYVLIGCSEGLGRSMAAWMFSRGARNFILMSRSGEQKQELASLLQDLRSQGGAVNALRGSVEKYEDVERAVDAATRLGPLRGVIQAANALKDAFFNSMSYNEWLVPLNPKVHGTKVLCSVLLDRSISLDFLLMTSSFVNAIGHVAQSNYCAANAFLDTMAAHMRSRGIPATSLMVGLVSIIGAAASRHDIIRHFSRSAAYPVFEKEFLQHVENAIQLPRLEYAHGYVGQAQVLTGLDPEMKFTMDEDARARLDADPRFRFFLKSIDEVASRESNEKAKGARSGEEGEPPLAESLRRKLSDLLVMPLEELSVDEPIPDLGLDSLAAASFFKWLKNEYGFRISFGTLLVESLSVAQIAERMEAEKV